MIMIGRSTTSQRSSARRMHPSPSMDRTASHHQFEPTLEVHCPALLLAVTAANGCMGWRAPTAACERVSPRSQPVANRARCWQLRRLERRELARSYAHPNAASARATPLSSHQYLRSSQTMLQRRAAQLLSPHSCCDSVPATCSSRGYSEASQLGHHRPTALTNRIR